MGVRIGFAGECFSWVNLMAHDCDAAGSYYSRLFGWEFDRNPNANPTHIGFYLDGHRVASMQPMPVEMRASGVPSAWISYVNVVDVDELCSRAMELGGEVVYPAMKLFDFAWISYILDPSGAILGHWQPIEHFGAELVNVPGSFCWNELATRDLDAVRIFYGELFGWTLQEIPGSNPRYCLIRNHGRPNGAMLQMNEQFGPLPSTWGVYFSVAQIEPALDRVRELGGQVYLTVALRKCFQAEFAPELQAFQAN